MNRKVPSFLLACLAATSFSASAAEDGAPPKVFSDLGATMQSRVCGELMTGLAMGGVQALKLQAKGKIIPEKQKQAVYDTGAQAVVLLTLSGSLKLEERLKAGEVTQAIEKMDPTAHINTAMFCKRRVEAWIRAGQVDRDLAKKAYGQAKNLLDSVFSADDAEQ